MSTAKLILLNTLCTHYKVEMSFFNNLSEINLIKIQNIEESYYIYEDDLSVIEKIIRMHQELNVNIEGIDIAFNLLEKIDGLQSELVSVKNRLKLYEG